MTMYPLTQFLCTCTFYPRVLLCYDLLFSLCTIACFKQFIVIAVLLNISTSNQNAICFVYLVVHFGEINLDFLLLFTIVVAPKPF